MYKYRMDPFKESKMAESSKILYMKNLTRILGEGFKNLNGLKDTEKISKILDEKNINTARTYYIAIVSSLKDKPKLKKEFKYYHEKMMYLNKNKPVTDEKTESQKEKWVDFTTVEDKQKQMQEDIIKEIGRKKKLPNSLYDKLVDLVIISLYTLQPPRRNADYFLMKVGLGDDTKYNYIEGNKFYFNNYKTAGTYQQQVVEINPKLLSIITLYLKHRLTDTYDFLIYSDKKPINASNKMNYCLMKIIGVGCSMLRNSYATKYLKPAKDILNKVATDMGTSSHILQTVYTKTD